MSFDRPDTREAGLHENSFKHNPYTDQPPFAGPAYGQYAPNPHRPANWKPYAVSAVMTALTLVLVYQQVQISHLNNALGTMNSGSLDFRNHMESMDTKLSEMNNRLTYLDSKLSATDQKAQTALDKLREQENRGNFVGNILRDIGKSLGIH